jgi:dynein heavy chain
VFIAAACASYYGPFTGVFREKLVAKWMEKIKEAEIPVSERFNMSEVMGDPMEI